MDISSTLKASLNPTEEYPECLYTCCELRASVEHEPESACEYFSTLHKGSNADNGTTVAW